MTSLLLDGDGHSLMAAEKAISKLLEAFPGSTLESNANGASMRGEEPVVTTKITTTVLPMGGSSTAITENGDRKVLPDPSGLGSPGISSGTERSLRYAALIAGRADQVRQHTHGNEYEAVAWPEAEPDRAYAVYLQDGFGRFRTVGFDLDTKRGYPDADVKALTRLLDAAGIRYVVTRSGPNGGYHLIATFKPHVPREVVVAVCGALAKRLPSLDKSPMTNRLYGALRPPGALHRDGSGFRNQIIGDEDTAQRVLSDGNDPCALIRLLHDLGKPTWKLEHLVSRRPPRRDLRNRVTENTWTVLETGKRHPEDSRSEVIGAAVAGLINAGFDWGEGYRVLTDKNLGISAIIEDKFGKRIERRLHNEWLRGQRFVQQDPPIGSHNDARIVINKAAEAIAQLDWHGRDGRTVLRVLQGMVAIFLAAGELQASMGGRQIAEACKLSTKTVLKFMPEVLAAGYVTKVRDACGRNATVYRLDVPKRAPLVTTHDSKGSGDSGVNVRTLQEALATDVFRHGGLPSSALMVLSTLDADDGVTAKDVAKMTNVPISTVYRALARLGAFSLAVRAGDGLWYRNEGVDLKALERELGTHGATERQRERHGQDRREYHEFLDLLREIEESYLPKVVQHVDENGEIRESYLLILRDHNEPKPRVPGVAARRAARSGEGSAA